MSIRQTIKKVLKEQSQIKDELIRLRDKVGLEDTIKYVGNVNTYIKLVYNNDIKEFFKNENIEPYFIKEADDVNMLFSDILVNYLNLKDSRGDEKELGDFSYGNKNGILYKITVRLRKVTYLNGKIGWKVVGMSGSHGFGYSFINVRDRLGKRYKKQIFQQIIDRYNLKDYK